MNLHLAPASLLLALSAILGCGDATTDEPSAASCDDISSPCPTLGETRCGDDLSSVIACRANAAGCLVWVTQSPCGAYGSCQGAACVCQNECDSADGQRCELDAIQHCRLDPAGCLHWEETTRCADIGKTCEQQGSSVVCVGGCDIEGELRCTGDLLETCSQDAQGFLDWFLVVDCASNEQVCSVATGVAECISL